MSTIATHRAAQVTLPAAATSPARARHFVTTTLRAWRAAGGDDVLLVVSELVTNALLHARTTMTVRLVEQPDRRVRVSVADGSPQAPQERNFSVESGTGRGLRLLAAVAEEWGVTQEHGGKTVWCVLPLDSDRAYGEYDAGAAEAL